MNMPGFTAEASLYRISSHSPGPRNHVLNAFGGKAMSLIVPPKSKSQKADQDFLKLRNTNSALKVALRIWASGGSATRLSGSVVLHAASEFSFRSLSRQGTKSFQEPGVAIGAGYWWTSDKALTA